MRLAHKLLVAPGTAIVLLLVFGAVAIHAMRTERLALADIYENRVTNLLASTQASAKTAEVHSAVYRLSSNVASYHKDLVRSTAQDQSKSLEAVFTEIGRLD